MNTVKVPTRKGLWGVCVAALFSLALAACGNGQDVGASSPPPSPKTGLAAEWLTDEPIDTNHTFVDGIDTAGIVVLSPNGPVHQYEAGKQYGNCVVVYHRYADGTYDVAIKPSDPETSPGANDHIEGVKADKVDPWINNFVRDCKPDTF